MGDGGLEGGGGDDAPGGRGRDGGVWRRRHTGNGGGEGDGDGRRWRLPARRPSTTSRGYTPVLGVGGIPQEL